MFRGAGRYLSVEEPAMVRWPCCVCCACWDGFCTVWWYLELVLCWRGGSFGLLRRLLSSIPPGSAVAPEALFGEPTRCCAGSGADACKSASLPCDSATRPSPLDTLWRRVRRETGWCSKDRTVTRDAAQRSKVVRPRGFKLTSSTRHARGVLCKRLFARRMREGSLAWSLWHNVSTMTGHA